MHKSKLIHYILIFLFILLMILFVILESALGVILVFISLCAYNIFLKRYVNKKYSFVNDYINNKEVSKLETILLERKEKTFLIIEYNVCVNLLLSIYILENRIDEYRELISYNKLFLNNVNTHYYNMLIAIKDNDYLLFNKYYMSLINNKNSIFNKQKEKAYLIKKMIDTKEYNEIIDNETTIPLLKKICDKYKNGEYIEIKKGEEKKHKWIDTFLIVINIVAVFLPFMIISFVIQNLDLHSIEQTKLITSLLGIYFIFLIIPIINIIYWIKYRYKFNEKKSHGIVGLVTLIIMFLMGTMSIKDTKSSIDLDYYLMEVENIAGVSMNDSTITFREYHEDNNGGINYTYNYEILVRYNEGVNIASLIESNDNYINNFNDDIMSFLGDFYKYDTLDDDYFMMYNYDNNTYNTLYNEPNYQYLIFSYNIESNYLYVIDINSK